MNDPTPIINPRVIAESDVFQLSSGHEGGMFVLEKLATTDSPRVRLFITPRLATDITQRQDLLTEVSRWLIQQGLQNDAMHRVVAWVLTAIVKAKA